MLLAFDVGNTNIVMGVFDDGKMITSWRLETDYNKSADEYGMIVNQLFSYEGLKVTDVKDVIISTVVPSVLYTLQHLSQKYFHRRAIVIGPGIKTGLVIKYDNPKQVGSDRIVNAVAAHAKYSGPLIIIDFGTATTYDLVDATGAFVSGVTAPGIRSSAKALWEDAAKLPEIEIKKPDSILAKETITSMQAGLVYGQIGQTEYIVRHMKEEANLGEIKVVATGGLGRIIASETSMIDVYDPNLTLKGMNLIYKKQNRKSGRIKQS